VTFAAQEEWCTCEENASTKKSHWFHALTGFGEPAGSVAFLQRTTNWDAGLQHTQCYGAGVTLKFREVL
jgi:hypothetical protein